MSYQPPTNYNQQNPDWQGDYGQPGSSQSGYPQQGYSQPGGTPPPETSSPYTQTPPPPPNYSYYPYSAPAYPQYSVPTILHERGRGVALAGFTIGIFCLVVFVLLLLVSRSLSTTLVGAIVLIEIPLSIVGIFLSAFGCRSRSRRVMAIVGLVCSSLTLVVILLLLIIGANVANHS